MSKSCHKNSFELARATAPSSSTCGLRRSRHPHENNFLNFHQPRDCKAYLADHDEDPDQVAEESIGEVDDGQDEHVPLSPANMTTRRSTGGGGLVDHEEGAPLSPKSAEEAKRALLRLRRYIESLDADLILGDKLNSGSFGTVYRGQFRGQPVAIKVENSDTTNSLETEHLMYQILHSVKHQSYMGIPRCLFFHSNPREYRILVLPFMGNNLKDILALVPSQQFSIVTTLIIATQVLSHLEFMHKKGIVHRDMKPANLIIGSNEGMGQAIIYLVDFGLSKQYRDPETGVHVRNGKYKSITGTLRYLGLHAHEKNEASRRDDLQSLAYMLIYFLRGRLPWQSLPPTKNRSDHERSVYAMKRSIPSSKLCEGLPGIFERFLNYSLQMEFAEAPDYEMLQTAFFDAVQKYSRLESRRNSTYRCDSRYARDGGGDHDDDDDRPQAGVTYEVDWMKLGLFSPSPATTAAVGDGEDGDDTRVAYG